jgi:CheY-like chemotaxis protein
MSENNGMPGEGAKGDRGRTVLIVEDSENSAATLEIALMAIPRISVRLACSGIEALRMLRDAEPSVEVIVTDLNMPRMDGFELIRRVRADRRLRATPIVVISADTDPATPERVAQLGVSAFFAKPYSPAQVRRKLEQILDGKTV